jgi:ATP/maltotriose-dependent transcriptional regulator MalT
MGRWLLTELRQSDLRFTTGEAAAFLNRVMGLNLAPDHVTALESRTETLAACQSPLTITS